MDLLEPLRRVGRDIYDPDRIAAAIETALLLAVIALGAWVALRVSLTLVRRTAAWRVGHPAQRLTPIIEGLLRYAIIFTALILMLSTVHVNVTPVLASATVLGVALGFGAQQIIRDLLAGVFLLSEGIIQTGDIVRVDSDTGVIERVTLRVTQIRKFSGELLTVPNGSISKIGNLSRDYARAVVQVLIPYSANVGGALEAVREAGQAWASTHAATRQAEPKVDGITELRDAGAVIQCSVLVPSGEQWAVASELSQRVLEALAQHNIIPGTIVPPTAPPTA